MIDTLPLLSIVIFLPLFGALVLTIIRGDQEDVAYSSKKVALWISMVNLFIACLIWAFFDPQKAGFQFVEFTPWLPGLPVSYHVGIDGISLSFILLSAFLTPICILASWKSVTDRLRDYMIAFLVLETLMIGTFAALDVILFYIFFEIVLIPMFIIIGIWGGKERIYASFKFFLYTLLGSLLMLLSMIVITLTAQTSSIPDLLLFSFDPSLQTWLWLGFFASFAVKIPMWPFHTWLPDAHVQAPTAGSVILAGVLLKMGGYGFLRFSLPMLPDASIFFSPLVFALSVVAVIYGSLVAFVQEDIKKLIAYSSVAHMGFVTAGIFSANPQAVSGAIIHMLSHGLISAALFLCVGVVYDRVHSREIAHYKGIILKMPRYGALFMLFTMASIGLPGTSGFVGEFLILAGTFRVDTLTATLLATGMVLGAAYMLYLYRRVFFGEFIPGSLPTLVDLDKRELLIFIPLAALILWMGIYPTSFIGLFTLSLDPLTLRELL